MHAAIPKLPQEVRNQIAGAVMFGDTKNAQEKGKIRGLDADKFKIFCEKNDGVCGGGLNVNAGHFAYAPKVSDAVSFLTSAVTKASKGSVAPGGVSPIGGGE
jgi:cutinase